MAEQAAAGERMLIFDWGATVGDWSVPMWLSWVVLTVTTALDHLDFSLFRQSSRSSSFR
jgi:hypothetical protein